MKRSRAFLWKCCPLSRSATNTPPLSSYFQLYSVFCVSLCRLSCTFTSMDPSGSRPSSMWPSKFRPSQQGGSIFVVGLNVEDRECRGGAAMALSRAPTLTCWASAAGMLGSAALKTRITAQIFPETLFFIPFYHLCG